MHHSMNVFRKYSLCRSLNLKSYYSFRASLYV